MNVVLTDDEIAAVAIENHLAWPVPFPTVATDVEHLAAAVARGRRSLLVRELATPTDFGVDIDIDVVGTLEQAVSSRHVMAWVASVDSPAVLAGSSTVIYRWPSGDLIDLTSAIGIHDLRETSTTAANEIVVALAKNVFDFGFAGRSNASMRLLVGRLGEGPLLLVSRSKVESAAWAAEEIGILSETTEWNPTLIEDVLTQPVVPRHGRAI